MDKKLYIACLKENFDFLDFWEKHGQAARDSWEKMLKYYSENKPRDQQFELIAHELERVEEKLNQFGLRTYAGQWDDCLNILDPANKKLPERLPFDFLDNIPAVILATEWGKLNDPGFEWRREPLEWMLDEPKPQERLLKIDLSRKKKDLLNDFKKYLDTVDHLRGADDLPEEWADNYQAWGPDVSREGKPWDQLEVWRMRKEQIPFSEIAKGLKITQDAAKKAFYKAYERTQGRPYDLEKYRKFILEKTQNKEDLALMCQNCRDKKCHKTRVPCPEIIRYADMERVGLKEFIGGEKDLLDDGGIADYRQYQAWEENEKY